MYIIAGIALDLLQRWNHLHIKKITSNFGTKSTERAKKEAALNARLHTGKPMH